MINALEAKWTVDASRNILPWLVLALFLALIFAGGGYGYYRVESRHESDVVHQTLKAVADLKVKHILSWRDGRLADARVFAFNSFFAVAVQNFLSHPRDQALRKEIRDRLALIASSKGYVNLMIAGRNGELKFSLDPALTELESEARGLALLTVSAGDAVMGDLYYQPASGGIRIDTAAPIMAEGGRVIGVLFLRDDPTKSLSPLVESWPTEARTAETALVRREGETALIITELRFQQATALSLRIPLNDVRRLAVQAVLGKRGFAEGLNYRSKTVVADISTVPDSNWLMIATEDRDEVMNVTRSRGRFIGLLTALFACLSGTGVGLLFLRQRKNIYKGLFQAELERVEALDLFRTTLYSIGDGVIVTDSEGRIKHLNRAAEELTGWSENEARDQAVTAVFRIVSEMTRAVVEDPLGQAQSKGSVGEMVNHALLIARDGAERPIADSCAPIYSPKGNRIGLVLVFRDQTQQRRADQAIRESEVRYRSLFDLMGEGVAVHQLVNNDDGHAIDYEIVDANPANARHTGISAEVAKGSRASRLYGLDKIAHLGDYERVARGGEPLSFETFFAPLNRHFRISVFSPKKEWFATVFSDISDRKRTEAELAAEKERLSVTLRSIGDGVIATDVEGRVVLINKVAESLTGWDAESAFMRPIEEVFCIVNASSRERCEDPVGKVLRSGTIVGLANHTILVARDGREYVIADSGSPIRDKEGRTFGVVLVFRDVTLKEKLEEELLKAEKLEAMSVLAGGIAHDFNNILTGILGNISLAAAELAGNTPVRDWIEEAKKASIRAKDLVQQLLTFAKGGAPVKKLCDGGKVIREAARFSCHGSAVSCRYEIASDLWPIEVDEGQFGQVIQNMVINSVQAMPAGGTITLTAENAILSEDNRFLLASGHYLKVCIVDEGVGIPERLLPRIFDPYFSTKQSGSGLGLATCYSIIKNHQGHIEVSSTLGAGSSFTIYLPAAAGRQLQPNEERPIEIKAKGRRILVMDDEELVSTMAKAMLGALGFDAEVAPEGAKAIELYREAKVAGRPFDAVIMDLTVAGGMGGKDAIILLRRLDPSAKVIVSSGYSNDSSVAIYRQLGFLGVLAKPYSFDNLKRILSEVLNE
jgi:PAS domain S-box-containing protein